MGWIKKASDADLHQSMELAASAAKEARATGDRAREDALQSDLNDMITEAETRGWTQGSGWPSA
ncbi:hypothetical protein [Streptomyces longwoodensis]|uniref:hypothetical protein n=1 Tax=Streptomyces longwoodensis TaxID=68231 RepID=UPI0038140747